MVSPHVTKTKPFEERTASSYKLKEVALCPEGKFSVIKSMELTKVAKEGNVRAAQPLVERSDVDLNYGDLEDDRTALFWAASRGHFHIVNLLLRCPKVEVNKPNSKGETPLWIACCKGHADVARLLVAHPGVLVNSARTSTGSTSLVMAAQEGHAQVAKILLSHPDIQVNAARSDNGATPLIVACLYGHLQLVRLLLDRPEIDTTVRLNNVTALGWARRKGHTSIAKAIQARQLR